MRLDVTLSGPGADAARDAVLVAWDRCLAPSSESSSVPSSVGVTVFAGPAGSPEAVGADVVADDLDLLMHQLSPAVTMCAITARAGELMMLHAAALADPVTGRTVVFVAPSGTGKTTLCRTLGVGLDYVTDETAAIEASGRLVAYPKPLSVLNEHEWRKEQVSPTALGLGAPSGPCELAALLILDRTAGPTEAPEVVELPISEALAALAPQSSYLGRHPAPLHALAALVHRVGGVRRVRYHDAADLAPLVSRLLEAPPAPEEGAAVRRTDLLDLYVEDGVGVAMAADQVVALSPLATRLLEHLVPGRWIPLDLLVERLVEEFGDPGDPATFVAAAVAELAAHGIVTSRPTA